MPEMVAKLVLDAGDYQAQMSRVGQVSEEALGRVGQAGRTAGEGVAGAGVKIGDSMAEAGRHIKTVGERLEESFGAMRLTRIVGGFVLIRTAAMSAEAGLAGAAAQAELYSAQMHGGAEDVARAELKVLEVNQQLARSFPILGGIAAHFWNSQRKEIEETIKKEEEATNAFAKMEEENRRLHNENVIEKAKLEGASDSERMALKAAQEKEADQKELSQKQKLLDDKFYAARDKYYAEAKVRGILLENVPAMTDPGAYGVVSRDATSAREAGRSLDEYLAAIVSFNTLKKNIQEKEANTAAAVTAKAAEEQEKQTEKQKKELDKQIAATAAFQEALQVFDDKEARREEEKTNKLIHEYDAQYNQWKLVADRRLAEAQRLQDQLRNIERGGINAEESYQDRLVHMDEEAQRERDRDEVSAMRRRAENAKNPAERRALEEQAAQRERDLNEVFAMRRRAENAQQAQRYQQRAGQEFKAGDPEEARRLLDKALDFAERAGDRNLMANIEQQIQATFAAQKTAVRNALQENRSAIKTLSDDLTELQAKAAHIGIHIDAVAAYAELNQLSAALGLPQVKGAMKPSLPNAASIVTAAPSTSALPKGMSSAEFALAMGGYDEGGYIRGPSGVDTVPAWLTPGEFVVNAAAAQRNAGWLSAINEGITLPGNAQRFAGGGFAIPNPQSAVHNHTTVNITVNPPPGSDPRDIARSVVDEIARLKIRGRG
jgi:DNA repair exonuclease SbcCD ATPase subunit